MKNFRLYDIKIDDKLYKTNEIKLINKIENTEDNYFTLIIGNNGTGKSRFLSTICRYFNGTKSIKKINCSNQPTKVIAVTHSISDKFPLDKSFNNKQKENLYSNMDYVYLGTRNQMHTFSSKVLMNRAIDILFENYTNKSNAEGYRHIFNYLGYRPVIKLNYKIVNLTKKNLFFDGKVTIEHLKEYLKSKIGGSYSGFRYKKIEAIIYNENDLIDICSFYSLIDESSQDDFSLIANFSENNISKLELDSSVYNDKYKLYKTLKLMKSIDLVKEFEINVYKEDGFEFNFNDASSGESNILSTLIALIPLVENNSLILIDEPEISLHPSWQYQYINLLKKLFEYKKGCHIIIATHSHFLVSDLPINSSSVIAFSNNKNIIESELIESSTFGWSAENILLNIFKLPTSRNYYLSQLVSEALEILSKHNKSTSRLEEIKLELLNIFSLLKDQDPLKKIIELIINKV